MIKEINGFKGYFISSEGKVFCNLGKGNRDKNKTAEMYEIKGRPTKNGYLRVYMRRQEDNKRTDKYIHRLVAEYFLEKIDGKDIVNHKDCNRSNNNVENLEWTTTRENVHYAMELNHLVKNSTNGRFESNFDYKTIA